jgi:hypothetical protein
VGGDGARPVFTFTELRGFEETSYEFTPEVGTWIGEHG